MKRIILMRHGEAKSSPRSNDAVRPLTKKGIKMSSMIASSLKKEKVMFDAVISSPAIRALETAYLTASPAGFSREKIVTAELLYQDTTLEKIVEELTLLNEKQNSVLVVGHNPAISKIASALLPGFGLEIPVSGILVLDFDKARWADIREGEARFVMFKIVKSPEKSEQILKIIRKDLENKVKETLTDALKSIDESSIKSLAKETNASAKLIGQKYSKQALVLTITDFSKIKAEAKQEGSKKKSGKKFSQSGEDTVSVG
jgi:phosphohistidine phosphatase